MIYNTLSTEEKIVGLSNNLRNNQPFAGVIFISQTALSQRQHNNCVNQVEEVRRAVVRLAKRTAEEQKVKGQSQNLVA